MRASAFALLAASWVLAAAAPAQEAAAPAADAQRVQADARRLVEATYAGDVDVVLELTHPALIEKYGSRAEARRQLLEAMEQLERIGLKIEIFEFPEPVAFVEGNNRLYAVIPTRAVVSAGEQRLDRRGFQVGISDPIEKKWTYVEGSKFDAALRAKYFPDFPKDYEFPEVTPLQ